MKTGKSATGRKAGFPTSYKTLHHGAVSLSRATRRLRRQHFRMHMLLQKIERLQRKRKQREENIRNRQQVRTLKAAWRTPRKRVRNREDIRWLTTILNPVVQTLDPLGDVLTESAYQLNAAEFHGRKQWIYDTSPVLKLDPPRNPVSIGQQRKGAFNCSAFCSTNVPNVRVGMRKSKWPLLGLRGGGQDATAMNTISWDLNAADAALIKAYADLYTNDINMNEYIVEWKQVLGLLRDPLRTMKSWRKHLNRWTRRDSWMWIPQRSYRKLSNGDILVSKLPVGGVLMSMRTKRLLDPKEVTKSVVDAAVNRWLQYRYGIAPMAKDINTVLGYWLHPKPAPKLLRGDGRQWVKKTTKTSVVTLRWGRLLFEFRQKRQTGTYYSAGVKAKMTGEPSNSYNYGVHPSQWTRVIWNSIPYSFVADWLCDVDKWLTSRIEVPWIQPTANYVTAKRFDSLTSECTRVIDLYQNNKPLTLKGCTVATNLYEAIERRIDLPRPLAPPWSDAALKLKNIGTAVALALNLSRLTQPVRRTWRV